MAELKPGDILVQCGGEPWAFISGVFTGKSFPHAVMISEVQDSGVKFLENGKTVSGPARIQEAYMPNGWVFGGNFEVWRPNTSNEIKSSAIRWIRDRSDKNYGFDRLIGIGLLYRLGLSGIENIDDDDLTKDDRGMVCSETIAMAYYRSGYDVAPSVSNRQTMPWDLRDSSASTRVF